MYFPQKLHIESKKQKEKGKKALEPKNFHPDQNLLFKLGSLSDSILGATLHLILKSHTDQFKIRDSYIDII